MTSTCGSFACARGACGLVLLHSIGEIKASLTEFAHFLRQSRDFIFVIPFLSETNPAKY